MPVFLVLVRRILKLLLFMIDCASPFGINATVLMSYHSGQCRGQDSASGALNQISFPLSCDASVALRMVPLNKINAVKEGATKSNAASPC